MSPTEDTLRLHLDRYDFAAKHLKKGHILDIACGSGYGSFYLAEKDPSLRITAVDIDPDAIAYARKEYVHPSINFMEGNAMEFDPKEEFDSIISLETIEHLADPAGFVKKMSALLHRGGRFIASAPITPSMDANPFHLHDFTGRAFRKLFLDNGLNEITGFRQVQKFNPLRLKKDIAGRNIRANLLGYYFRNPGKAFLRVKSVITTCFKNIYLVSVFENVGDAKLVR